MSTGSFANGDFINHRYQVIRRLGAGAMGTVYLAEDLVRIHRRVALKILKSETLDDSEVWSKGEYEALGDHDGERVGPFLGIERGLYWAPFFSIV